MTRIIVNADDCGKNVIVNQAIEKSIQDRQLSSTTIMANMDDLSGAYKLYDTYHSEVSFGWHMNLTEGRPVKRNQLLLDKGFYEETHSGINFCAQRFEDARYKFLDKETRKAILEELCAQYEVLRDNKFSISHIDSHHHIHTSLFMIRIIPELTRRFHITKMRNIRNMVPFSANYLGRTFWTITQKLANPGIKMTDLFEDYAEFNKLFTRGQLKISNNATIELMCHPGHPLYHDEDFLSQRNVEKEYHANLITYYEL